MRFVGHAIAATILVLILKKGRNRRQLRAFNRLLWWQHDLVSRHHATRCVGVALSRMFARGPAPRPWWLIQPHQPATKR